MIVTAVFMTGSIKTQIALPVPHLFEHDGATELAILSRAASSVSTT